jgi:hypothetical protein
MPEQTKKRPDKELRIGLVRAAIWRNDGDNGVWYNVKFERLYKDKEGDESWKSSASFGRDDLLVLRKVADQAHTWIVEQEVTERSS